MFLIKFFKFCYQWFCISILLPVILTLIISNILPISSHGCSMLAIVSSQTITGFFSPFPLSSLFYNQNNPNQAHSTNQRVDCTVSSNIVVECELVGEVKLPLIRYTDGCCLSGMSSTHVLYHELNWTIIQFFKEYTKIDI